MNLFYALSSLALFISGWGFLYWLKRNTEKRALAEEENRRLKNRIDDLKETEEINDRFDTDQSFRDWLYSRFTTRD